jgi:hypothetical protein
MLESPRMLGKSLPDDETFKKLGLQRSHTLRLYSGWIQSPEFALFQGKKRGNRLPIVHPRSSLPQGLVLFQLPSVEYIHSIAHPLDDS